MSDFGLDLTRAEEELDDDAAGEVVLGVLDGSTDAAEWIDAVRSGDVLVLAVEGDLNRLAAGFAREIRERGGSLTHFRGFLVVTPEGVDIDTDRL
ncbi:MULTISPECIES: DUF5779 family protein [Halolamina]|uniref:Uncharacterized protein n=1 Tax=Halolamina pelagica TaxID=699431 RepID=A0A1I5VB38_9EURY|nr:MULTISPECIES: DUF5779 family protein [Halolamina]NHX37714.1 hypothetical protein [Halolamina sp. R1-12]SFQ04622.1 hypothetical protein SAMN05216277_1179 [Halolamina pelagica]